MAIASAVAEAELNEPVDELISHRDDLAASVTPLHRPRPSRKAPAAEQQPAAAEDDSDEATVEIADESSRAVGDEIDIIARATSSDPGSSTGTRRPSRRRRDRRRTSVPSWDEIMLGGTSHDE